MNLFKEYYPVVKSELKKYKGRTACILSGADAAEKTVEELQDAVSACKWNLLIRKYLEICDDEEKKFIDLLYFKNNPILDVGLIFPLSARACQEWREEILKNLVLLALNEGLIEITPAAKRG